jgi:DNA-binding beta-propeller fold protein YncE
MQFLSYRRLLPVGILLGYVFVMLALSLQIGKVVPPVAEAQVAPQQAFARPTNSSPIALSADDSLVVSVNPEDDTLSIIRTADNTLATNNVAVGDEPQSVAIDPAGRFVFVANAASNTVSVVEITTAPAFSAQVRQTLLTGAEPWSVVVSPDGRRVFVANAAQDTITVINNDGVNKTIIGDINLRSSSCNVGDPNRHFQPRGLAVTEDNTRLYVARFFSFTKEGGTQASDVGKEGIVCQLNINTASTAIGGYTVAQPVALQPRETGFNNPAGAATSAYPNQLQSIVVRGNQAYLPNIAASPSGPLRFNIDTQSFVNVIDNAATGVPTDSAKTINMHLGARDPEPGKTRLFFANPWAIGFTSQTGTGAAYAVSAGSDLLVKLNVDAAGVLTFTGDVSTTTYVDLNDPADPATQDEKAGKNPLGIAINSAGTRAYVMNFVSRNVSVVDVDQTSGTVDTVLATIQTEELPAAGSLDELLLAGAEVFFSSRGHFDGGKSDRLSSEGWQNCASCHFQGLTDANVWAFGTGPRKSVQMNGTWDPRNPDDQRVLNYSAIFDEVQDFEINIRNVSGPGFLNPPTNTLLDPNHGLIISDTGDINAAPAVVNAFALANGGRPQLTLTLPGTNRQPIPALDAMKEWVRFNIRTPNGPIPASILGAGRVGPSVNDINQGRLLFDRAGCATCHGGGKWTNSQKDFVSPPPASEGFAVTERTPLITGTNPIGAQYLGRFLSDIGSFNLNVPGSSNVITGTPAIGGVEKTDNGVNDALGLDYNNDGKGLGYNIPSILGAFASPPYYHNGACETLACVLQNVRHRTAGRTQGGDVLSSDASRRQLVAFLESVDFQTQPAINLSIRSHDIAADPAQLFTGVPVSITANIKLFGPKVLEFPDGPITVEFLVNDSGGFRQIGTAELAGIPADNGTATVSVLYTPPANPQRVRIFVRVDSLNEFAESIEENDRNQDNFRSRVFLVGTPPADRTRPVVSNVQINNDDVATSNRTVTISFDASDPAGPAPEQNSGLKDVCVTSYSFDDRLREFVPQACTFKRISGNGPFSVTETLPVGNGLIYAFVAVRDNANNLSAASFDFISAVPQGEITLGRGAKRLFRVRLDNGESISFSTNSVVGDVDIVAFSGDDPPIASTNIGEGPDSVTLTSNADGKIFTIEVEGQEATNRFTAAFSAVLAAREAAPAQAGGIGSNGREISDTPLSEQPPALNAAFADVTSREVSLPIILRP